MTFAGRLPRFVTALALVLAGCTSASTEASPASLTPAPSIRATVTATATATASPSQSPTPQAIPSVTTELTPPTALVPGAVDRSSLEVRATYDVELYVAVASGRIQVATVIEAHNESGAPIDRLELNTIAARLGGLRVTGASVDDRAVTTHIDDQTVHLPLGGVLLDGAPVTIRLSYEATLRPDLDGSDWLFSRAGGTLALYRWIPWVSRAVSFDRPNHGDPFVTPSSPRVRVRVTTDVEMVLASPGAVPTHEDGPGVGGRWSFQVADVRDVAVLIAPDFALTTGEAAGIEIRAYTRPDGLDGDRLVTQAARALLRMADRLGVPYPGSAFTVVETRGGYGMESPGLIFLPRGTAPGNLAYLIHHETAHQWFYGLVGNDQQAEPFADEAAADLLARTVLGALRASRCDPEPLDRPIDRYTAGCYYEVVYVQGGNLLDDLRAAMGTDRFWAAVGGYLEANRSGLGGTRQLLEALRAASPADLLPTLRARFPSTY
jgi:hypothetical protein